MKFTLLDFIFILGIAFILFPIMVFNWQIGMIALGAILVFLSLKAGGIKSKERR